MRNEEDRPVHLDVNVSTGTVTHTAVTDQEWDEMDRRAAESAAEQERQLAESEQLAQAVAAHPDPVVQALARRAGVV